MFAPISVTLQWADSRFMASHALLLTSVRYVSLTRSQRNFSGLSAKAIGNMCINFLTIRYTRNEHGPVKYRRFWRFLRDFLLLGELHLAILLLIPGIVHIKMKIFPLLKELLPNLKKVIVVLDLLYSRRTFYFFPWRNGKKPGAETKCLFDDLVWPPYI